MKFREKIENINAQAINFIGSKQENTGNFRSNEDKPLTFYTGLIISALEKTTILKAKKNKDKGVAFLIDQKSSINSYNYWQRESENYIQNPLPDDLDDTSIALLAIYQNDKKLITEQILVDFISLLIKNEKNPGGPYETWILPTLLPKWKDIDIVVNSNIAIFLLKQNIQLQALQDYFDSIIVSGKFNSHYYYNEIIIIYFLSKAYTGSHKEILIKKILSYKNKVNHWENALFTALSITTLLNLGVDANELTPSIEYLVKNNNSGQWDSTPFIIESISGDTLTYSSCDAYVSACCVEALSLYQVNIDKESSSKPNIISEKFKEEVYKKTKEIFINKYPSLSNQFNNIVNTLAIKDPLGEIPLISFNVATKLNEKKYISKSIITDLGILNILGWIGYGIYDSILDGEDKIQFLPLATICTRLVTDITHRYIKKPGEYKIIDSILGDISIATAWEYHHCRLRKNVDWYVLPETLPDYGSYGVLAQKSLGHAIGPILLCLLRGEPGQAEIIKEFFTHYLIARQLNDDAHDWLEDLQNGYLNSISVLLLKHWPNQTIDIKNDTLVLQELFWNSEIDSVSILIRTHCDQAKGILKKITILSDVTFLELLLFPLEQAAREAITERDKTKRFLSLIEN